MKKKLDSINVLKALACLVVFLYHSGIRVSAPAAVCVFFMLSGFTMGYSAIEKGAAPALSAKKSLISAVKRILKLYPLHLVCMLPLLLLNIWEMSRGLAAGFTPYFFKRLALNVLLLQSWAPNSDIAIAFNGVAWFLSTLMFLYFCFPYIFTSVKKLRSVGQGLAAIVLLAALQFALGFAAAPLESFLLEKALIPADGKFAYWFSYIFPPFRLIDFSMGCILGWIFVNTPAEMPRRFYITTECVTVILLLAGHVLYLYTENLPQWEAFKYTQIYLLPALSVIYTFALGKARLVRLLTNRFTLFIAGISSDFFLLHQNIIRFSIMFLSMLAIPFEALKIIIPLLCFVLSVAACLIWKWLKSAVLLRSKR